MAQSQPWQWIPTYLSLEQFEEFVFPHLPIGSRGPQPKLSLHAIFNYILKLLHLERLALISTSYKTFAFDLILPSRCLWLAPTQISTVLRAIEGLLRSE